MNRRRDYTLAGIILALGAFLIIAGCMSGEGATDGGRSAGHGSMTTDGERFETTAGFHVLPSFLNNHTDYTSKLYASVEDYIDILRTIDCYCGCMISRNPHDSLLRCYIVETKADGSVVWSDHSAACGICKMELEDVMTLAKQGKPADEIREFIDGKYKPAGL